MVDEKKFPVDEPDGATSAPQEESAAQPVEPAAAQPTEAQQPEAQPAASPAAQPAEAQPAQPVESMPFEGSAAAPTQPVGAAPVANPYEAPAPDPAAQPYAAPAPDPTAQPYAAPAPDSNANPYAAPAPDPAAQPYAAPAADPTQPYAAPAVDPTQPYAGQPDQPYQQAPGQPPVQPPYQPAQQPVKSSNGAAIASLVCGIAAIVLSAIPVVGIILGIVALILGIKATKTGRDGKATAGKITGIIGLIFGVILTIAMFAFGCALFSVVDRGTVTYNESDGSYSFEYDDSSDGGFTFDSTSDEAAAEAVVTSRLDELVSMPSDLRSSYTDALAGEFTDSGFTLEEIGVTTAEYADWMLNDISYDISSTIVFDDEATVYGSVTTHDLGAAWDLFGQKVEDFSNTPEFQAMSYDETLQHVGQLLRDSLNETTDMYETPITIELTKEGGDWVIDESVWNDEIDYVFWLNL